MNRSELLVGAALAGVTVLVGAPSCGEDGSSQVAPEPEPQVAPGPEPEAETTGP